MTIKLVDLKRQYRVIAAEIDAAMRRVVENAAFVGGVEVEDFERGFAAFCGAREAVGVANGTDALTLALRALGVGGGDEVITVANTFVATGEAIVLAGARPVFCDVDPQTLLMDPGAFEAAIGEKTRCVIPVHLFGRLAPMDAINRIADARGIVVLEDAAQAHGASLQGVRPGRLGRIAAYSFYPGKNLGAYGDGGAVVTDDADLAARVRLLRDHGRTEKYLHREVGVNSRLDALQAAILRVKLAHLEAWNEKRRSSTAAYRELLEGVTGLALVPAPAGQVPAEHLMVVRVPAERREHIQRALREQGIETGVHYPVPLHRQPAFVPWVPSALSLPVAERAAEEILSLPLFPELTRDEVSRVCGAVREVMGRFRDEEYASR